MNSNPSQKMTPRKRLQQEYRIKLKDVQKNPNKYSSAEIDHIATCCRFYGAAGIPCSKNSSIFDYKPFNEMTHEEYMAELIETMEAVSANPDAYSIDEKTELALVLRYEGLA